MLLSTCILLCAINMDGWMDEMQTTILVLIFSAKHLRVFSVVTARER